MFIFLIGENMKNVVIDIHETNGLCSSFESIASAVQFMSSIPFECIEGIYSNNSHASSRLCEEYEVLRSEYMNEVQHG